MAVGRQLTHSADAWKLLHGVVSVASFLSDEINWLDIYEGVPVQAAWFGAVEDDGVE